jgi:hypothetical protein
MKKIYLACPYSHPEAAVRETRFQQVNAVAADLMLRGNMVFSPISHTHPIALAGDLPKGWNFWAAYDKTFIQWCDEVWVLTLEGVCDSVGVRAEIDLADRMGKVVRYISAPYLRLPESLRDNINGCVCFNCYSLRPGYESPDCACDMGVPEWSEMCSACPKKQFCDTALHPELYIPPFVNRQSSIRK